MIAEAIGFFVVAGAIVIALAIWTKPKDEEPPEDV